MNTAPIRIKVGCALDGSVEETFAAVEKRARKAAQTMARDGAKRGPGNRGPAGRVVSEAEAANKAFAKEIKHRERLHKLWEKETQQWERAHAKEVREQARSEERANRERERIAERHRRFQLARQKKFDREASRISRADDAQAARFAQRTSHRFTRFLAPTLPIASMARRTAADVLRGVGVDASVSGSVGRSTELQRMAYAISNQGYNPGGSGRNRRRVSASDLISQARSVGEGAAMDPTEALAGLEGFTAKTGDLALGRDILEEMAQLAGATGASLSDTVDAAGDVANALGEIPNKGQAVAAVMRQVAGQGKIGAVEIKDLARQMAKIASAAGSFGGDQGKVITELAALAQIARSRGGAASATQAATSVAGFANILKTPKRREAFRDAGIQLEDERGMLRDPLTLIKESIAATGGEVEPLKKMWANVVGAKPVEGLANIYKQAGRGDAGMAAVEKELTKFLEGAAVSQDQIQKNNAERMKSTAAKAQQFQNQLDRIVETAANDLIPAMQQLAPVVLDVAKALSGIVSWAAKNPGSAIGAALGASIARAAAESAMRTGVERALLGGSAAWNRWMGGGAGAAGGAVGAAGGAAGGGGFLGRPTAGGALGAAGIGLMIGAAVGANIYSGGISSYDATTKQTDALSRGLGDVHGKDIQGALVDARTKLDQLKEQQGMWGSFMDLFGAGNGAEIKGVEDLIARKEAELTRYQGGGETKAESEMRAQYEASVASGQRQPGLDPDAVGRAAGVAVGDALRGNTLNVAVRSLPAGTTLTTPAGREP